MTTPTYPLCENCGHPVPPEGVWIENAADYDRTGQERPRCADTACVAVVLSETLQRLARETVATYRDEFPAQAPDWDSEWWVTAWDIDGCPGTFEDYQAACRAVWERA